MSHDRFVNALKRHATSMDQQGAEDCAGKITSVGPDGTTCKVQLLTGGQLSGWLPIEHIGVGNNSVIVPPNIGDLVMVAPHEGDAENWRVVGRLFSTAQPPPNSPVTSHPVKSGEVAIINGAACVHFTNDGTVHIHATTIEITGTVTVTGNITATGEITAGFGGVDSVTLQQHRHGVGSPAAGTVAPSAGT